MQPDMQLSDTSHRAVFGSLKGSPTQREAYTEWTVSQSALNKFMQYLFQGAGAINYARMQLGRMSRVTGATRRANDHLALELLS